MPDYDAVVVGAGPNGLCAAIELARNNQRVLLIEGQDTVGGGSRTQEITLPGFRHDICSAVFTLGHASPFLRSLDLERYGLSWVQPEIPVAHALDGGSVFLHRDLAATAAGLGSDGAAYTRLLAPFIDRSEAFYEIVFGSIVGLPRHPLLMARFGLSGLPSARRLVKRFKGEQARALIAGLAAHATSDLSRPLTGAMAIVLGAAGHTEGYPFAAGGSQTLVDALAAKLEDLGGEIATGQWVRSLSDLPSASAYLLDVMPEAAASITGNEVATRRRARMTKWRHGPATFKVDYATSAPIPWRDAALTKAGTVHVGGTFEEVAEAEGAPWRGEHAEIPFLILAQPSITDPTRSPDGQHTVWAYAHVPNGADDDITDAITAQIERFAPGFAATILAKHTTTPTGFDVYNPNNVGGDIGAGRFGLWQVAARPRLSLNPYRLAGGVYLCSAATPPGAGVHGMNGFHAARSALEYLNR